jgi:hypothetical protein
MNLPNGIHFFALLAFDECLTNEKKAKALRFQQGCADSINWWQYRLALTTCRKTNQKTIIFPDL